MGACASASSRTQVRRGSCAGAAFWPFRQLVCSRDIPQHSPSQEASTLGRCVSPSRSKTSSSPGSGSTSLAPPGRRRSVHIAPAGRIGPDVHGLPRDRPRRYGFRRCGLRNRESRAVPCVVTALRQEREKGTEKVRSWKLNERKTNEPDRTTKPGRGLDSTL